MHLFSLCFSLHFEWKRRLGQESCECVRRELKRVDECSLWMLSMNALWLQWCNFPDFSRKTNGLQYLHSICQFSQEVVNGKEEGPLFWQRKKSAWSYSSCFILKILCHFWSLGISFPKTSWTTFLLLSFSVTHFGNMPVYPQFITMV